jgi:hypothetical protein
VHFMSCSRLELHFGRQTRRGVSLQTDAPVSFGTIPRNHWVQPEWIDEEEAKEAQRQMAMYRGLLMVIRTVFSIVNALHH